MRLRLGVDGEIREIDVAGSGGRFVIRIEDAVYRLRASPKGDSVQVRIGKRRYKVQLRGAEAILDDGVHRVQIVDVADEAAADVGSRIARRTTIEVRPPMPGRVVRIAVRAGERVRKGQTLLVLEAMKMQNEIPAPGDGIVRDVTVTEGETISVDQILAAIEILGPSPL